MRNNQESKQSHGHHGHRSRRKPMKRIGWGVSLIQLILSILVMVFLVLSGMLPVLYEIVMGGILLGLLILCRWLMWHYHPRRKFRTGLIIAIVASILLGTVSYYLYGVVNTLQSITDSEEEITVYGVYVLLDDPAETIQDAQGYIYGILSNMDRDKTDEVVTLINEDVGQIIATSEYDDMLTVADGLMNQEVNAVIINEALIDTIVDTEGYEQFADQIREIAQYEISNKVTAEVKNANEVFTVFISGIDVSGAISTTSRSDVNILAVINPKTHQVLLVSTPRDYYVPLSISNGVRDKLTHAGIYGINTSMDTLGMLYDVDVDYYFRINFSGFQDVITALGGVTVDSECAFSSNGYNYVKGENYLNAKQALYFARERHAFGDGDRQRGRNQMALIEAVINKMMSPAVLTNYSELMSGLEGSFETSVPYSMVSGLVQDQINGGVGWDVQRYSVDGSGTSSTTYSMPSQKAYVMVPDETTVTQAKKYIDAIEEGEFISIE